MQDRGRVPIIEAMDPLRPTLADLTGAELYVFEADASAHGTAQELHAVREELDRRVTSGTAHATAQPAR